MQRHGLPSSNKSEVDARRCHEAQIIARYFGKHLSRAANRPIKRNNLPQHLDSIITLCAPRLFAIAITAVTTFRFVHSASELLVSYDTRDSGRSNFKVDFRDSLLCSWHNEKLEITKIGLAKLQVNRTARSRVIVSVV